MNFGQALTAARVAKGWTQRDLSIAMGYQGKDDPSVSALETGRQEPTENYLNRIKRALGVDLSDYPKGGRVAHMGFRPLRDGYAPNDAADGANTENFGEALTRLRKAHGLTLRALAAELNKYEGVSLSGGMLSAFETGDKRPDATTMSTLCGLLSCDLRRLPHGGRGRLRKRRTSLSDGPTMTIGEPKTVTIGPDDNTPIPMPDVELLPPKSTLVLGERLGRAVSDDERWEAERRFSDDKGRAWFAVWIARRNEWDNDFCGTGWGLWPHSDAIPCKDETDAIQTAARMNNRKANVPAITLGTTDGAEDPETVTAADLIRAELAEIENEIAPLMDRKDRLTRALAALED